MILIICTSDDVHVDHVLPKIATLSHFVLYTDLFLSRYYYLSDGQKVKIFDRKTNQSLEVNEVRKVWHRRTIFKKNKSEYTMEPYLQVKIREAKSFLDFLKAFLSNVPWLSGHPSIDAIAESKLNQINTAIKLGFRVPKTVFSNNKQFLLKAFTGVELLALKSIAPNFLKSTMPGEKDIIFYTALLPKSELAKMTSARINTTINFVQEYIEKKYELRITIVGKQVFACKIISSHLPKHKGAIDFRQGYDHGLVYEVYDPSDPLISFCREYLKSFKLNFGCFDFVVDQTEVIYFLECNPNGQWLWIEKELPQLIIGDAICKFLEL